MNGQREDVSNDEEMFSQIPTGVEFEKAVEVVNSNIGRWVAESLRLSDWGLPRLVVEAYASLGAPMPFFRSEIVHICGSAGVGELFRWQSECLSMEGVLEGRNLVYSAPTSAGKSLVAELLLFKRVIETSVRCRRKALLILPFIAVAREKMLHLQKLMGGVGVKVGGFMGGYSTPAGLAGSDVAVCTLEKGNSILNRLLETGEESQLAIVVVDELHMIADTHRGFLLELLLTKLLFLSRRRNLDIQLVGMSATLPNLSVLADWLQAAAYETDFRPVPLREYVVTPRGIREKGSEAVLPFPFNLAKDEEGVLRVCLEGLGEGFGTLVFCASKRQCEQLAENLARRVHDLITSQRLKRGIGCNKAKVWGLRLISCERYCDPKRWAIVDEEGLSASVKGRLAFDKQKCLSEEYIRAFGDKLDQQRMAKLLLFAVAFHHAGLTMEERELVERGFRNGLIGIIIATSTLSAGLNLPARRVVLRRPKSPQLAESFLVFISTLHVIRPFETLE